MTANGEPPHDRARARRHGGAALAIAAVLASGWALFAACTFPEYSASDPVDAAIDETGVVDSGRIDTAPNDTGPFTFPDGRVCLGHDEDFDGVPDVCDNCPNVANRDQAGGEIGDACKPGAEFIGTSTRLVFDPMTKLGSWTPFGSGLSVFAEDKDSDSLLGGTTDDGDMRFVVGATGSAGSATVVTTQITYVSESGGSAGILLRVAGAPGESKRFLVCALSIENGFAAAHAPDPSPPDAGPPSCTGGPCTAIAFPYRTPDDAAVAAQFPFPASISHRPGDTIGLRASVTKGDGTTSGELECRVFDPRDPSTLESTDPKYAVKVSVPSSRWIPSGEVGFYAQRAQVQLLSVDVLRGP